MSKRHPQSSNDAVSNSPNRRDETLLKAGARQTEPPPKLRQKIDDYRNCPKAGGNIDVKPDGELLSHLSSLRVYSTP